ncbi:acyl carrier protein [Herbiconiux daphne]|uniref:Acyl carrier protein n=1 Tax=Herbiconiux daphne TaxID=2970914 RepID=A0ABT2H6P2_9MICO|nr:acyl carrier protein [Herbiconiux daphne]MCS5735605.1 acyl carrier protein [Herbiconiux daphne]
MSQASSSPQTESTPQSTGDWLIERIRLYNQVDAEEVTLDAPLTELGLDSIYVMTLCGDIEDTYGLSIDPTFFAEFETLGQVATALDERIASA